MDIDQFMDRIASSKMSARINQDGKLEIRTTDGILINDRNPGWVPREDEGKYVPRQGCYLTNLYYTNGFYAMHIACELECNRLNKAKQIVTETPPKFYVPAYVLGPTPGAIDDYWAWYARMAEKICGLSRHPFEISGEEIRAANMVEKLRKMAEPKKQKLYRIASPDQLASGESTIVTGDEIRCSVGGRFIYSKGLQVASVTPVFSITELD